MSSAWIINQRYLSATYRLRGTMSVQMPLFWCFIFSLLTGKTRCSSLIAFFNRCSGEQARSFAMSAYIYRVDEGLQFCIKAIQDFAYSGFGGRGGKHGDIFWDNESYAIKQYLKMFES